MGNTLVIDFIDELLVMEGLPKKAFSMVYMTPPFNMRTDFRMQYQGSQATSPHSGAERSIARKAYGEKKHIAAERKYATYISHLVEAAKNLLTDDGTLCFVVQSRMSSQCNYQMILEGFFSSVFQISVERRAAHPAVGMPEHIIVYCCKTEKDAFFSGLREPAPIDSFNLVDNNGRRYRRSSLMVPDSTTSHASFRYEWMGITPREGMIWRYTKERLQNEYEAGNIDIDGHRAFSKKYHDESFASVPSFWNNTVKAGQLLSDENISRLLAMFAIKGQSVLCPFEHDGVFSYCANREGLHWVSLYSPLDESRSMISRIPDDDYVLSEDSRSESSTSYSATVKSSYELVELSDKMRDLQSAILAIQQSLGVEGADEESVVDAISEKVESLISKDDVESCIPHVKDWISPHWNKLEPESQRCLPTGEFVRRVLDSQGDKYTDYSPALIEYCKAFEFELFKKAFKSYVHDLIDHNVDVRREFPDDYDRRSDANIFASYVYKCIRYDRRRPYNWHFELGKMTHVLTAVLSHSNLHGIYADFRDFLETMFSAEFFNSDFDKRLTEIATLRNTCAHGSLLTRETSELARELIRQKLSSLLTHYK